MYNPKLVSELLGDEVANLMDGSIKIEPSDDETLGDLKVGDKITFNLKNSYPLKQFIVG